MDSNRGFSSAAMSLLNKNSESDSTENRKKNVVKSVLKNAVDTRKKKIGKDTFNPNPEIQEKDTIVKT